MTEGAFLHSAEAEGRIIEAIRPLHSQVQKPNLNVEFFEKSYPSANLILFL